MATQKYLQALLKCALQRANQEDDNAGHRSPTLTSIGPRLSGS
jgi:hypothetical protein